MRQLEVETNLSDRSEIEVNLLSKLVLACGDVSQVAERLSVRQFFAALGETITSGKTLKGGGVVYL